MTFSPLKLDLNEYGIYPDNCINPKCTLWDSLSRVQFQKDARLVILLHGWGADGSDLAPLAPSLLSQASVLLKILHLPITVRLVVLYLSRMLLIYVLQTLLGDNGLSCPTLHPASDGMHQPVCRQQNLLRPC